MPQEFSLTFSTFRILRKEGFIYVDKTKYAYEMITGNNRRFFLARPRRFGKSLFVSTLKEILLGNRELFQGLWIDNSDYQWEPYGVIALDISGLGITDVASFRNGIRMALLEIASTYSLQITTEEDNPALLLRSIVMALHKQCGRVAILIDEYDSPILHAIKEPERAGAMRDAIRDFLIILKSLDEYINVIFITGVSSFVKAGLFSGINNLHTITLNEQYAAVCGYTDEEVDHYFSEYITAWAEKDNKTYQELRQNIKDWYNGYHFGKKTPAIYNPYSLMHALDAKDYSDYWFQSGLPTFLAEILKKQYQDFDPEILEISGGMLQGLFDVDMIPVLALMFQAGYLTIIGYDQEQGLFRLDYPNRETKLAMQTYLFEACAKLSKGSFGTLAPQLKAAFNRENMEGLVFIIRRLFAHVPYQLHMKQEKFYHALLQMACTVAGLNAQSEYSTSHGRIDLILNLSKLIYVIEIKFNDSAENALKQIEERRYYERLLDQNKKIILMGFNFKREPNNFDVTLAMKELGPEQHL
jgi:Holliday junction resolvase-like predicted endonuclease